MKWLIALLFTISVVAEARGGGGFGGGRSGGFSGGRSGGSSFSTSKGSSSSSSSKSAPSRSSPSKPFSTSKNGSFGRGTPTPPSRGYSRTYYASTPSIVRVYTPVYHNSWGFFEYYMFYHIFLAPRPVVYYGNSVSNTCQSDKNCLNGEHCNIKINKCETNQW